MISELYLERETPDLEADWWDATVIFLPESVKDLKNVALLLSGPIPTKSAQIYEEQGELAAIMTKPVRLSEKDTTLVACWIRHLSEPTDQMKIAVRRRIPSLEAIIQGGPPDISF